MKQNPHTSRFNCCAFCRGEWVATIGRVRLFDTHLARVLAIAEDAGVEKPIVERRAA